MAIPVDAVLGCVCVGGRGVRVWVVAEKAGWGRWVGLKVTGGDGERDK